MGRRNLIWVVEIGKDRNHLEVGDLIALPFKIACRVCFPCHRSAFPACGRSNPKP